MVIDECLVELLLMAEDRRRQGQAVSAEALCPDRPDLWPALRELLHGLDRVDRLLAGPGDGRITASGLDPGPAEGVPRIPDFNVLRLLGRGGMGEVYEAEQLSLRRRVALKVLTAGALADPRAVRRFERESRAAARLHHTNIVPVFGVGEHDGTHYYVMQYIEGRGLDAVIEELKRWHRAGAGQATEPTRAEASRAGGLPSTADTARSLITGRFAAGGPGRDAGDGPAGLPYPGSSAIGLDSSGTLAPPGSVRLETGREFARGVARIGLQVAGALAYAHAQGILHRDIKPSNLLLDADGNVWVADFGLAKAADADDLTHTGDILGTIRYLAPERFQGGGDARADLYALGLTLYELLALRPAFEGADRATMIRRVMHEDPVRLRRLNRGVPADLETIVHRAMAREPSRRYPTAAALAEDLERFLQGRPIRARRVSAPERAWRWCRRDPLAAGLLAGLVTVFLVGFATVTALWRRADVEAARAGALARAEAEARAAESKLRIRAQAEVAARDLDRGLDLARQGHGDLGMLWMAEALRQAPAEERATGRMIRANLAAWERASLPLRAILEHGGHVVDARFRRDGRAVLTGSGDGTARLWDAATGRPLGPPLVHGSSVTGVALSPDGGRAFTAGRDQKVRSWDPVTGRPDEPTLDHGERVWGLDLTPDGRLILTWGADYTARLWDAATGRPAGPTIGPGLVNTPAFSQDGRLLVAGGRDGAARTWDVATGRLFGSAMRPGDWARLSPDGRTIATAAEDGAAMLWDAATRRPIAPLPRHAAAPWRIRFSPDGRRVLTLSWDATARISDAANGRPVGPPLRQGGPLCEGGFSPDGRLVVTASLDHTARVWDAATGRPFGAPLRHRLALTTAVFSPDGRLLLTASQDGTARLWEVDHADGGSATEPVDPDAAAAGSLAKPGPGMQVGSVRFSPDRTRILMIGGRGVARLVHAGSGQPVGPPVELRWPDVRAVDFSPDGTRVATASHDAPFGDGGSTNTACQVWDAASGRPISPLLPHINWVGALDFRPDGAVLATGDYSGAVHLWDVRTGVRVGGPLRAGSIVRSVAFSPDGRVLAVGTAETAHQVLLWDLSTNRLIGAPIRFRGNVRFLGFSGDGTRLAVGSNDGTVRLVEVATGRVIGASLRIGGRPSGLAFSPDGRSLLTVTGGEEWGGRRGVARLWDARSGRAASPRMVHPTDVSTIDFSPDGERFATGCTDGTVRLWDVATARTIGPPRRLRGPVEALAFDRDGRSLLVVDQRGNVSTWSLAGPRAEPVERAIERVESHVGLELDATREPAVIDPEEWRRIRGEAGNPPTPSDPVADADWHESSARDAEAIGDGFGARWHLDRLIAARPEDGLLHARRARAWLWSEDSRSADADLDRTIELGPRDRVLDWLEHRAADALEDNRPADALRMLDRVVAGRPGDWRAYSLRAPVYARLGRPADREADLARAIERGADIPFLGRLAAERSRTGRWAEAVCLYDRAIAMGTVPYEVWTEAAIAHLRVGDEAGYRRVCEALRGRHPAAIPELLVRWRLADVLVLGPGGLGDDGKGLAWIAPLPAAVRSASPEVKRGVSQTLGALLFRAGRPAEAIETLREGIATGRDGAAFEELVFLAMASWQVGARARARDLLDRLEDHEPNGPSSGAWWAAQARRSLLRESQRMILDSVFPPDPFSR